MHTRTLVDAVSELSRIYTRDRSAMASLDKRTLLARSGFFLARDLPKVFGPLDELVRAGMSPQKQTLRVLDVGAGMGATSFGLARWLRLRKLPAASLEVVALETHGPALRAFQAFVRAFGELPDEFVPLQLDARAEDVRSLRATGKFDLILFGFVLNELFVQLPEPERAAQRAELLRTASERLSPGGALIVLEPALKETARALMQTRDVLAARAAAPYVLAPCLHHRSCPMLPSERDWCHQELAYALPPGLADVARAASLRYEGLSYASLVLANEVPPTQEPGRSRVVSDQLLSKGKLEMFGCSADGYLRLTRLARHESDTNQPFGEARRGDVLAIDPSTQRIQADTRVRKL